MGRKRQELGRCECNGPQSRKYDWDADETTKADAKLVREISRGQPGPWVFSQFQVGPEEFTSRFRLIPYKGVWSMVEVSWEATVTEKDACKGAAWEGGPSLGAPGFGWIDSHWCVWVPEEIFLSAIRIKSKKTVEIEHSGHIIEFKLTRQTIIAVGASFSLGPVTIIGGKGGVEYELVTVESNTIYTSPPINTPEQVLSELHK
jgi:hypothetical protein